MGKPILFSGPMVRAICEGRKTVTRRVVRWRGDRSGDEPWCETPTRIVRAEDFDGWRAEWSARLGYSLVSTDAVRTHAVGDRLWLRETWRTVDALDGVAPRNLPDDAPIWYDADDVDHVNREGCNGYVYAGRFATESMTATIGKGRPAIFMQHRFARGIRLDVVSVRPERLRDITDDDAMREGCAGHPVDGRAGFPVGLGPRDEFRDLWNRINGDGAWDANPWVWRIEFARVPA